MCLDEDQFQKMNLSELNLNSTFITAPSLLMMMLIKERNMPGPWQGNKMNRILEMVEKCDKKMVN